MIWGFFLGMLFTLLLLMLAVFYRRKKIRQLLDKVPEGGENSRERVGEDVIAVLNSGTKRRKVIQVTWFTRMKDTIMRALS